MNDTHTMPSAITIRRLGQDDLHILASLLPKLSDHHNAVATSFAGMYPTRTPEKQIEETRSEMEKNQAIVEVMYHYDTPIGFAKGSFDDGCGYIDWLHLDPEFRGMGLGSLLLKRIMAYFRKKQIHLVDLMVVAGNKHAKRFYEKHGFTTRLEMLSMKIT